MKYNRIPDYNQMYYFILLLFFVRSNGLLTSTPYWDQTPHIQTFPMSYWVSANCTATAASAYPYTTLAFGINRTFEAANLLKGFVAVSSFSPYSSSSYYYYYNHIVTVTLTLTQITITTNYDYCINYIYFQVMLYTT